MGRGDIISSETYGTSRANAYKILEDTLNLKDVRIYDAIEDEEGKLKRMRLLLPPTQTGNTFIITLSTTPLRWTAPGSSGTFYCPGWPCSG